MNRTTVMLPGDLKTEAKRAADNLGISLGELIRVSLKTQIAKKTNTLDDDPFLSDNAVFIGDIPNDLSLNHDRYLYGNNE